MANFCEVVAQRLAWDQAPRWGKKAKKGVKQQKIKIILKKKKTASEANRAVDWGGERATARLAFYFRSFPPKCAKWSKACQVANFCEVVGQRLAWHQAPRWGKKAKKGVKQQKIKIIIKKKKKQ